MLGDLIKEGLVDDGEVLRYKNKNGRLMLVGRARSAGIEVKGSSAPLKYSAFEERAGKRCDTSLSLTPWLLAQFQQI